MPEAMVWRGVVNLGTGRIGERLPRRRCACRQDFWLIATRKERR